MFFRRAHPVSDIELGGYLDERLDAPARARLEAHLPECSVCQEAIAEFRVLRVTLRELPAERAPRSFALREAQAARPAFGVFGALVQAPALAGGLATAAVLVLGVLVGVDVGSDGATDGAQRADETVQMAPAASQDGGPLGAEDSDANDYAPPSETLKAADRDGVTEGNGTAQGIVPEAAAGAAPPEEPLDGADAEAETAEDSDDGELGLRIGEGAAAAVALGSLGVLGLIWWRRRPANRVSF